MQQQQQQQQPQRPRRRPRGGPTRFRGGLVVLASALLLLLLPFLAAAAAAADGVRQQLRPQRHEAAVEASGSIDEPATGADDVVLDQAAALRVQRAVYDELAKEHAAHPDATRAHYYAACPFFDYLMNSTVGCPYFQFVRTMQTTLFENVSSTTSSKLPFNPTGLLPLELTDLRPDPPFEVPQAIIDHERPTYYWLYRHINSMYNYANRYDDEGDHVPPPPVPPGWSDRKIHIINHDILDVSHYTTTPMAMTMMHHERNTMLLVIRGTLARQEWAYDFQYNFGTPESGATAEFPGRVHQGVYSVHAKLRASVLAEVDRFKPRHIFVTGHSLGGALTHMASFAIARRHPSITVDAVAFGSIMIGDETFMREIQAVVNLRAVMYLGTGWDGQFSHLYRVGDMIPQFTCKGFHGCPGLKTGTKDDWYYYAPLGPYVPFYSEQMPNADHWVYEESLLTPYFRYYVSTHMCSYICWTAQGLDPETRCYFPRQYLANPGKYDRKEICMVWSVLGQQVI